MANNELVSDAGGAVEGGLLTLLPFIQYHLHEGNESDDEYQLQDFFFRNTEMYVPKS
jgi:hypothetical protein